MDEINEHHDATLKLFDNRLEKLREFKAEISRDVLDLCKHAEEIKEKFRKFEASEENKISDCAVLINGSKFYAEKLEFDVKGIIEGLDQDIKTVIEQKRFYSSELEENLKQIREAEEAL